MLGEQQGAVQAIVEIEFRYFAAVQAAEIFQVADNLRDLPRAEQPVFDQALQLLDHMLLLECGDLHGGMPELARQFVGVVARLEQFE